MPNLIIKIPATEIILPYKELNFKVLEEKIMEVLKDIGKQVLEEVIKAVDKLEKDRRGEGLKIKGNSKKYLSTVFGVIQMVRRRYNKEKEKGSRYLADEKLGIRKGMETSPVREMMESEMAVMCGSYRKASEFANKYLLDGRSHESIRQVVLREGNAMEEYLEADVERTRTEAYQSPGNGSEQGPDVVYVEVDGTGLKIQKSRTGKKGSCRNREVKLGIVYSGKENRYAGGNGKQKRLVDKFVYASLEGADWFMEKFSLICEKVINISKAKRIILGGDGAEWIKEGWKSYFHRAIYVLCKFHLHRAIMRAFGYSKEMQKKLKNLLNRDKIDDGIRFISKIINMTGKKNKKRIEKLQELRTYIDNNREGINAIERLKANMSAEDRALITNTGAIESNIFNVIKHRMKGMRQAWSVNGAKCILQVICRMSNEDGLDNWYSKERNEKIEIKEDEYQRIVANTVWADRKAKSSYPARMPALEGPHQDKVWVGVLREIKDGKPVHDETYVEKNDLVPEVAVK